MPRRPSYLDQDAFKLWQDTTFSQQLDDGLAQIRWPTLVDTATQGLETIKDSIWKPLPITVSPPAPADLSGPPSTPSVPTFRTSDFRMGANGESEYIPGPEQSEGGTVPSDSRGIAAPGQQGDLESYARAKARSLGIDPDIAVAVAQSEGGFSNPVRQSDVIGPSGQREQSFGPYQLNTEGGLGSSALAQGIDPRNPAHVYRAIDYALEHAAKNGWSAFHGAARVGIGPYQGIGQAPAAPTAARPGTPMPAEETPAAQAQMPWGTGTPMPAEETPAAQAQMPWGTYTPETLTPNQFTEGQQQGLSAEEAVAVCGPAAAVAFARANGRNPTLREAKELAQNLGLWDVGAGMHGPASQVQLLDRLGVKSTLQQGVDWGAVARQVTSGRPVIVDTPLHYYTVTGYDPRTGEFEFGQSAGVLRASGGKTRWRPDELLSLGMGAPRATIYMGGSAP